MILCSALAVGQYRPANTAVYPATGEYSTAPYPAAPYPATQYPATTQYSATPYSAKPYSSAPYVATPGMASSKEPPALPRHPVYEIPPELTQQGRRQLFEQLQLLYEGKSTAAAGINAVNMAQNIVGRLMVPATVYIEVLSPAAKTSTTNKSGLNSETGSGFIIQRNGIWYCISNTHLLHKQNAPVGVSNIYIYLSDGRFVHPKKLMSDVGSDVAVMELEGKYWQGKIAENDNVKIGEMVMAIGSPFGLRNSLTRGIVSALGRRNLSVGITERSMQFFIQTDATVQPGSSGGPLVNLRGEIIGMNSAIASVTGTSEGVSFAIPIRTVMFVVDQLIETGKVEKGFMGVNFDKAYSPMQAGQLDFFDSMNAEALPIQPPCAGAMIRSVFPGSQAEKAGLQQNDVIIHFNGSSVEDRDHLAYLISVTKPMTNVPIVFYRQGRLYTHHLVIEQRPDRINSASLPPK